MVFEATRARQKQRLEEWRNRRARVRATLRRNLQAIEPYRGALDVDPSVLLYQAAGVAGGPRPTWLGSFFKRPSITKTIDWIAYVFTPPLTMHAVEAGFASGIKATATKQNHRR